MYKVCLRRVNSTTYTKQYILTEFPSEQTRKVAYKKGYILDVFPEGASVSLKQTHSQKQIRAKFDRNASLYATSTKRLSVNDLLQNTPEKLTKAQKIMQLLNMTESQAIEIVSYYERGVENASHI